MNVLVSLTDDARSLVARAAAHLEADIPRIAKHCPPQTRNTHPAREQRLRRTGKYPWNQPLRDHEQLQATAANR